MQNKMIMVAATLLLAFKVLAAPKNGGNNEGVRILIEIDDSVYFMDTATGYHRDEAKEMCESRNMALVSFESEDKWYSVNRWMHENGFGYNWFWNDALKDANTVEWYWETSGEIMADTYWAPGQPSLNNYTDRLCINFMYDWGGSDDDFCDNFNLDALCQFVDL